MQPPAEIAKLARSHGLTAEQLAEKLTFWTFETRGVMNMRGDASYRMPDGSYLEVPESLGSSHHGSDGGGGWFSGSEERHGRSSLAKHSLDDAAEYHVAVRGPDIPMVRITGSNRDYTLSGFLAEFPSIALFVVPLYGPYTGSTPTRDVQEAIREFAVQFGKSMANQLMVFDFWVDDKFDLAQYQKQHDMAMQNLELDHGIVPALLVSNRSPFLWDPADRERRTIILTFRGFDPADASARLQAIAADLARLELPSHAEHRWALMRSWAKKHGILGALLGIAGGAATG